MPYFWRVGLDFYFVFKFVNLAKRFFKLFHLLNYRDDL